MTFDEFIEALLKAGWVARNDAQHERIRELWDDLCFKGLNIPRSNATRHALARSDNNVDVIVRQGGSNGV